MPEDLRCVEYKYWNEVKQEYEFRKGYHHGFFQHSDEDSACACSVVEDQETAEVWHVTADHIRFLS